MRIAVISILATGILLGACGGPPPKPERRKSHVSRLPRCFAALERFEVRAYRNQDWCKNIWYKRGKFSHQTEPPDTCNIFEGTPLPFDAQAREDFEAVAAAVAKTHVKLYRISNVTFDAQGRLNHAQFHLLAGRYSYVYSPGYKELPEDMPREREHTRIDANWYFVWEDWN